MLMGVLPLAYAMESFGQEAMEARCNDTIHAEVEIDTVLVEQRRAYSFINHNRAASHLLDAGGLRTLPGQPSLQTALRAMPGVDLRARGEQGVQADLSIRGSGFDQVLFLVNGVDFTDAQTGHHTLNLPLRTEGVGRLELIGSPAARLWGPGAFAGAVNAVTLAPETPGFNAKLQGGMYGLYDAFASGGTGWQGPLNLYAYTSLRGSSGFTVNTDFQHADAFVSARVALPVGELNAQCGYTQKSFGAQGFYSPKFPEQHEMIRALIASLGYAYLQGPWAAHATVAYRRHADRFALFRHAWPAWYKGHNHHLSNMYSARAEGSYSSEHQRCAVALIWRMDELLSTNLGEPLDRTHPIAETRDSRYTHYGQRLNAALSIEEQVYLGPVTLTGGGMLSYSNSYGLAYGYGLQLEWRVVNGLVAYASGNSSFRLPTMTDLYYQSPTRKGNRALRPEDALAFELGMRYRHQEVEASIAGYYRMGRNVIDWAEDEPGSGLFIARNHARVYAMGGEVTLAYRPASRWYPHLQAGYGYCLVKSPDPMSLGSSYAFDNLRHQAHLAIKQEVWKLFTLSIGLQYGLRAGRYIDFDLGQPLPYPQTLMLDMSISRVWRNLEFFASVSNLLNQRRVDFGNVPMPGIWVTGGVSLGWGSLAVKR